MTKMTSIFALFFVCFAVGYSIIYHANFSSEQVDRDPAAVGNIYDFSHLSGESLQTAAKQRLLSGFSVQTKENDPSISLGHFVFINAEGQKKFACQEYDKIVLIFMADGVAVAGEPTRMRVEGTCEFAENVMQTQPLHIPVSQITKEKAVDGDFQFTQGNPVTVSFSGLPGGEWPQTWLLESVEMKSSAGPASMSLDRADISKYLGHPIVLKF